MALARQGVGHGRPPELSGRGGCFPFSAYEGREGGVGGGERPPGGEGGCRGDAVGEADG